MGLEYITQPQVFLQPISALGGIAGFVTTPEYQFPPVTSFYTWTTSTASTATAITLDGSVTLLNFPGSFIISVGGVVQSPLTYTVNPNTRLVTFDSAVPSGVEITVTQIGTVALTANSFAAITASDIFNTNLVNTNLTASNILLNNNGSLIGATSATTISIGFLSARGFDLVHSPANDGVDPILNIGETDTAGFSGFRIRYEEPTNRLIGSSRTGTTVLTSFIINVATGQVGISGLPALGQALTVIGNISATGTIYSDSIVSSPFANIVDVSISRTFTNADNGKIYHFNTTSGSLSAIFPTAALSDGFNVTIVNTGTQNVLISSNNLKSIGTSISEQYGSAYVYDFQNSVFAIGRLI